MNKPVNKSYDKKPKQQKPKVPVATATISNNMATVKFNKAANPLQPELVFYLPTKAFCADLRCDGADKPLHDLYKIQPSDVWVKYNYLFERLADVKVELNEPKVIVMKTTADICHIDGGTLTITNGTEKSFFAISLCTKVEQVAIAETARKAVVFYWMDGTTLTVSGKYSKGKGEKQNG